MARIVAFLIAEQHIPNLFLFVNGTHVHHLNYGINLLSLVGLLLRLFRPKGTGLYLSTIAYGVGLALTFDEFGIWLTLGGNSNSRLTFDAILIIASLLTLIAMLTTVEGNCIGSSRMGVAASQSVSPVTVWLRPLSATISPGPASVGCSSLRLAIIR